jgi:hypothetical protein
MGNIPRHMVLLLVCLAGNSLGQQAAPVDTVTARFAPAADPGSCIELRSLQGEHDANAARLYKASRVHKALAFTTAGLLLAADAVGTYHFFGMRQAGHHFRDSIGFAEDQTGSAAQAEGTRAAWLGTESQALRVVHAGLIAASCITYTSTATIELSLPRMDTDPSLLSQPNIHRWAFYLHLSLMVANVGLGLTESYALSRGNHDLVMGAGIAHMVVGIAVPVAMVGSGLAYKVSL